MDGLQVVTPEPGQSAAAAQDELQRDPDVRYVEPNRYRGASAVPNDPYFARQWGASNQGQPINGSGGTPGADVEAPAAWDLSTGGATTAVIDSGIDMSHPDLATQIWANPGETGGGRETNGRDDDGNGLVDDWRGWDFVEGDNSPQDQNGHGTHVSGTIAAAGNNGTGVTGVSYGSHVMPLRVLDANGSGTVAGLISAYHYAAAKGARVVNVSITGTGYSAAERDAIESAPNTLFVVAAGNGGSDQVGDNDDAGGQYPCAYPSANIVCVAASDQNDHRASFSNFGPATVDLAAPGDDIMSTVPGGYGYESGTSMATPFVSGAAALIWSARPDATPATVKADLLSGVDGKPDFTGTTASGGRLDAARSLRLAIQRPPTAPAPTAQPKATPARVRPRVFLALARKRTLRQAAVKGLPLRVRCSTRCKLSLRVTVDKRTASRLRLARSSGRAVATHTTVASTRAKTVTVRLSKRSKRAMRRLKRVTLTVAAADVTPGGRTTTFAVTLRR